MTQIKGMPGSPNYCWIQAGYRIEREPRKFGKGSHGNIRHIFDPDGNHVMSNGSHEEELAEIKRRGIFKEE